SIIFPYTTLFRSLSVKSGKLFTSISAYFEDSEEKAGASNIVNTILGDFRAFDTMLEVIVLFIAGIGVFTLIKGHKEKEARKLEEDRKSTRLNSSHVSI